MKSILTYVLAALAFTATGCSRGGGSSGPQSQTGVLSVQLSDAPVERYRAVYVTVAEVAAHRPDRSGWQTVATPDETIDLLTLVNGLRRQLALTMLDGGRYTQLRLKLAARPDNGLNVLLQPHPFASYVIEDTDAIHELKVPSGLQSGIKIVKGFDINSDSTTELVLDFDVANSIVVAGRSGQWLLKPVIHVLETKQSAVVFGGTGEPGFTVTAQQVDSGAPDPRDRLAIVGTISDAAGFYSLLLEPGQYEIVAAKAARIPLRRRVDVLAGGSRQVDFSPMVTATGTLAGAVSIQGAPAQQHATISVRSALRDPRNSTVVEVEIDRINLATGTNYSIELPVGTHRVVAWTEGRSTQTRVIQITDSATLRYDLSF